MSVADSVGLQRSVKLSAASGQSVVAPAEGFGDRSRLRVSLRMNFPRALAALLSSCKPNKWELLHSAPILRSLPFSTETARIPWRRSCKPSVMAADGPPVEPPAPKNPSDLPRPTEIPFQAKVANSVHLVGTIDTDVALHPLPDGNYEAVTVLFHGNSKEQSGEFSRFSIPVTFQGDLAEIAACHLRENDLIYVSGQLTGVNPSSDMKDATANIKLLAHSLNLVKDDSSRNRGQFEHKKDEVTTAAGSGNVRKFNNATKSSWEELFSNPQTWFDNREAKLKGLSNPRCPDFKHKETGNGLWIDTAPPWVMTKLEGLVFGGSGSIRKLNKSEMVKDIDKENMWKSLVENPNKWWDNRSKKLTPTYPDFKRKDDGEGLWLSSAPLWVLPKLPPLPIEKNVSGKQTAH